MRSLVRRSDAIGQKFKACTRLYSAILATNASQLIFKISTQLVPQQLGQIRTMKLGRHLMIELQHKSDGSSYIK